MTTIRFSFDYTPDADWSPVLFAIKNGYFKDGNLDVHYIAGTGASDLLPLVGTDQQDIGYLSATTVILGVQQQVPVTAVGVVETQSPEGVLCGANVKTPKDLENGTLIFGDQLGGVEHGLWLAWAKANNIDVSKVKVTPLGDAGKEQLFITGKIDCYIPFLTSGAMVSVQTRPGGTIIFPLTDTVPAYGHVLIVNNTFLAQNGDAVKAFLLAYAKGEQYAIDHPAEAYQLVLNTFPDKNTADGRAALQWAVLYTINSWRSAQAVNSGLLTFTTDGWTSTKNVVVQGGLTANGQDIDISHLYTTQYLPSPPITP